MARTRRGRARAAAWGGALVVSAAALPWLAAPLWSGDLDRNAAVASVAGVVVGLAGLVVSAWSLRVAVLQLRQAAHERARDSARLDRAAEALARAVRGQWEAEAGVRALRRPEPLRLTWSSTARPVAAPAGTVVGASVPGRVVRLRLQGRLDGVADAFAALPRRRLVVLGDPGAGKTVLAMLLTLELLARRRPADPVPVLLSLASWDPRAEHLHTWLARRLGDDYPALASPAYGPAAPEELVADGRILPVLDGLDELPAPWRARAIRELDRARAGKPLVLTCRGQEYEQAIAAGGEALAAAAVVELEPVAADEAAGFLRSAPVPLAARWDRVVEQLRAAPDGPLAAALSTPLMVMLARTVYTAPDRDPGELVGLAGAGGRTAVERHLLDAFLPAAYADHPPAPGAPVAARRPPPDPDHARRWLTLLAAHLHERATRDLAWWQLRRLVPPRTVGLLKGLAVGLAVGLAFWLAFGFTAGLAAGLALGLIFGLGVALNLRFFLPDAAPARMDVGIRGRLGDLAQSLRRNLLAGLGIGSVAGLVIGLGFALTGGLVDGVVVELVAGVAAGLVVGLVSGLVGGLVGGLVAWLRTPVDDALAATPGSVLRGDRAAAVASGLVAGLVAGVAVGLSVALMELPADGLGGMLLDGLVVGLAGGLAVGVLGSHWGWFAVVRLWLAARGRLPWRLMSFLDDAHQRGVLRQAGAVYQFRHALLQDHLAAAPGQDQARSVGDQAR